MPFFFLHSQILLYLWIIFSVWTILFDGTNFWFLCECVPAKPFFSRPHDPEC